MHLFLAIGSLVLLGIVAGCDDEATPVDVDVSPDAGGGATPDAGDEDGYFVQTGDDELTLLACEVEEPCDNRTMSQITEGGNRASVEGMGCLFEALGQRRAGRYVHRTDHTFTSGSQGAKHTLIVSSDGTAVYARVPYGGYWTLDDGRERWVSDDEAPDPGQRCILKPSSYFTDCLSAIAEAGQAVDGSPAYDCAFGDGDRDSTSHLSWFESCETESTIACE